MGSYLQTTDAHFERAVADLVGHQVGHKGREMAENGEPSNDKNPEKRNVFLGSAGGFVSKNYPVGTRTKAKTVVNSTLCKMPGPTGGPIGPDLQTVIDAWPVLNEATRAKILRDVQRALK